MSETPLPSSFDGDTDFYEENRWQKFSRHLIEEPLIPIGCGLTCWALIRAAKSVRRGDHQYTNRMFRARIYAQAFTLVAMYVGSLYYSKDRTKRKEFEGVVAEKKAKEKNEAWIRELEARDREEKDMMAKREAARRRAEERSTAGRDREPVEKTAEKMAEMVAKKTAEKEAIRRKAEENGAVGAAKCVVEGEEESRLGILKAVTEMIRIRR